MSSLDSKFGNLVCCITVLPLSRAGQGMLKGIFRRLFHDVPRLRGKDGGWELGGRGRGNSPAWGLDVRKKGQDHSEKLITYSALVRKPTSKSKQVLRSQTYLY